MRRNKFFFFALSGALALFLGSTLSMADERQDLKEIQADIERSKQKARDLEQSAQAAFQEMNALRDQLIRLSQSVHVREETLSSLETELAELSEDEGAARLDLEERYRQSIETLMAMQRLALNPPEAIIALPQEPGDMVRSAILLRTMVPHIQKDAETLRTELAAYSEKRTRLESQKNQVVGASEDLDDEKEKLKSLIEDKKSLRQKYARAQKTEENRLKELSARAKNLQSLIKSLEAEKKRTQKRETAKPKRELEQPGGGADIVLGKPNRSTKPISSSKGDLFRPASGPVVMKFGAREELGGRHKGISIKARRGARIVATYDGQIAFAGPFRGYRQLLIIDHGAGFHTLLTGMERIDVSVGQWLLSGEPIGVMSEDTKNNAPLYFELRKNGTPINPLPWIRQRNTKARG